MNMKDLLLQKMEYVANIKNLYLVFITENTIIYGKPATGNFSPLEKLGSAAFASQLEDDTPYCIDDTSITLENVTISQGTLFMKLDYLQVLFDKVIAVTTNTFDNIPEHLEH